MACRLSKQVKFVFGILRGPDEKSLVGSRRERLNTEKDFDRGLRDAYKNTKWQKCPEFDTSLRLLKC